MVRTLPIAQLVYLCCRLCILPDIPTRILISSTTGLADTRVRDASSPGGLGDGTKGIYHHIVSLCILLHLEDGALARVLGYLSRSLNLLLGERPPTTETLEPLLGIQELTYTTVPTLISIEILLTSTV